jgi:hypothetical protein
MWSSSLFRGVSLLLSDVIFDDRSDDVRTSGELVAGCAVPVPNIESLCEVGLAHQK